MVELPFKFALSHISGTALAQLLFPFLPGGVLVVGGLFLRPEISVNFSRLAFPGYYSKLLVLCVVAYVLGLLLATAVLGVIGGLGDTFGTILGRHLAQKWSREPWKDKIWRAVAQQFIGKELAPVLDFPLPPEIFQIHMDAAKVVPDVIARADQMLKIGDDQIKLKSAEFEWATWCSIIDSYFPAPGPPSHTVATYISQAAYCSAVAVLILVHGHSTGINTVYLLWLKAACYVALLSAFIEYFALHFIPLISDRPIERQTGAMLRYLTRK